MLVVWTCWFGVPVRPPQAEVRKELEALETQEEDLGYRQNLGSADGV